MSTIHAGAMKAAPPRPRHGWMDMSRGLGVLLIVIVHAGSIYSGIGGGDMPHWIAMLDLALAPYRIPLLIFLSGMFLNRSLDKGLTRYTAGKIRNLLWPYLVWTAILVAIVMGPQGWLNYQYWLTGGPTLWYLAFLMIYFAVGVLFARVPVLVVAVYALAIAMIAPQETRLSRLFLLMSYFFVGAYAGQNMEKFGQIIRGKWGLMIFPIAAGMSLYFTSQISYFKYSPFIAPLVIASIVCACSVINAISTGRVAAAINFVGRNSIIYYVVHPGIYFPLYRALDGVDVSVYFKIGLALSLGIIVPTILAHLRERSLLVNRLFEGPEITFGPALTRLINRAEKIFLPQPEETKPAVQNKPQHPTSAHSARIDRARAV